MYLFLSQNIMVGTVDKSKWRFKCWESWGKCCLWVLL